MKTWARRFFVLLLLLALLAGGALTFLDSLVVQAVERGGTHALGTETRLDDADIRLIAGEFDLEGLTVANPQGFEQPSFLSLRSGRLALPLAGLLEQRLTIPSLELEGIRIDLERSDKGTNYRPILDHIARLENEPTPATGGAARDGGKTYAVQRLVLRDIQATINLVPSGGDLTRLSVTVPEIVVTDLASDMSLPQLCSTIVELAIEAAMSAGKGIVPEELRADLRGRLGSLRGVTRERLDQELGKLQGKLGERARELGPEAEKALQKASDKLGETLDGLLKKKD